MGLVSGASSRVHLSERMRFSDLIPPSVADMESGKTFAYTVCFPSLALLLVRQRCEGFFSFFARVSWKTLASEVFSWAELCEGLQAMNTEAAVSPLDPLPSSVLQNHCDKFRSLVLAFVLFAWIVGKCPPHWPCATAIPLHRPGEIGFLFLTGPRVCAAFLVPNLGHIVTPSCLAPH